MGKTFNTKLDKPEIEEIRYARLNKKKKLIKNRSVERRIKRAIKTKNIDEYLRYDDDILNKDDKGEE